MAIHLYNGRYRNSCQSTPYSNLGRLSRRSRPFLTGAESRAHLHRSTSGRHDECRTRVGPGYSDTSDPQRLLEHSQKRPLQCAAPSVRENQTSGHRSGTLLKLLACLLLPATNSKREAQGENSYRSLAETRGSSLTRQSLWTDSALRVHG